MDTQSHMPISESSVWRLRRILDVEGKDEALAALPPSINGNSDWVQHVAARSESNKSQFCPQLAEQCAVKGAGLQRVQLPPGNWFAPPGSNRGGSGGNKAVGALGVKGR